MYQNALIAILLAGLLFFGCASPNNGGGQGGAAAGQQNQTQGGNGQGGSGSQGGSGNQSGSGDQGGSGSQNDSGGQHGGQTDFAGMTYVELMALGVPMQCDITTTSEGVTVTSRVYKGLGTDMRSETPVMAGGPCPKVVAIMKADKYYIGCEQGELMQGCQWFVFPVTGNGGTAAGGGFSEPDYSAVPAAQISCIPWILDATKFQEPAGACNLQDMMNSHATD